MARLGLSCFGRLQILLDGQPVTSIGYAKGRALLVYLAVACERTHARDALAALLWPEFPAVRARANLRLILANLRDALGDAASDAPLLRLSRDTIGVSHAGDVELDVAAFCRLLAACEGHPHRQLSRCRACAARLERALALYHGEFLADFALGDSAPFADWALLQRERLHRQAIAALGQLAAHYVRLGQDERAGAALRRQLELDPWREEAYAELMELLARTGRRSEALALYATCRRVMADEFGAEPAAETAALYERLRDGSPPDVAATTRSSRLAPVLPQPAGSLLGRAAELAALDQLLADPSHQVVSVVGPGGIGKTRLALEVAALHSPLFDDGAAFVPLAGVRDPDALPVSVAAALDLPLRGAQPPLEQLVDALHDRELLLVLDNFEHLLAGAGLLATLARGAPRVTLLVTSRERLNLQLEWVLDLAGLSYPDVAACEELDRYAAVQLFVQRARQVGRHIELGAADAAAVAHICRLTEGLPLAIELAAAATRERSCADIAAVLDADLRDIAVSFGDVPERHRSIPAAFETSWRLLNPAERAVLARLAVFRGGFDAPAAGAVAGATRASLRALERKSLVRNDRAGRYELHELVRQCAGHKLAPAERERALEQHLACFLALAEQSETALAGPHQPDWLARLDRDYGNLDAALSSAFEGGAGETGARLAAALWRYWSIRCLLAAGRRRLSAALGSGDQFAPELRARLLHAEGILAAQQHEAEAARSLFSASLAVWRALGNRERIAALVNSLGTVAESQDDYAAAMALYEESLLAARELGNERDIAIVLGNLGTVEVYRSAYASASEHLRQAAEVWRRRGERHNLAIALLQLGRAEMYRGELDRAAQLIDESRSLSRAIDDRRGGAFADLNRGILALRRGDALAAAELCSSVVAAGRAIEDRWLSALALGVLARARLAVGDTSAASRHAQAGQEVARALGDRWCLADATATLGSIALATGRPTTPGCC